MRPLSKVVKHSVNQCSWSNPKLSAAGGILCYHRSVVLTAFSFFFFLGTNRFFMLSKWLFVSIWSLLLSLITLYLRWSLTRLQWFLGLLLVVLCNRFVSIFLVESKPCLILSLSWSVMFFVSLLVQLIFYD